jgi:hypothetical protein
MASPAGPRAPDRLPPPCGDAAGTIRAIVWKCSTGSASPILSPGLRRT